MVVTWWQSVPSLWLESHIGSVSQLVSPSSLPLASSGSGVLGSGGVHEGLHLPQYRLSLLCAFPYVPCEW